MNNDFLREYYEHTKLYQIVKDKTVIVVGRAQYLLDEPEYENQGEFIDSHDIVIRVNSPNPYPHLETEASATDDFVPLEMQQHLGKKTDILYIRQDMYRFFIEGLLDKFCDSGGIMVCAGEDTSYYHVDDRKYDWEKYIPIIAKRVDHHIPPHSVIDQIRHFYDTVVAGESWRWLTGIVPITEILKCRCKALTIIGFTNYMSSTDDHLATGTLEQGRGNMAYLSKILGDDRVQTGHVLTDVINNFNGGTFDKYFLEIQRTRT